MAAAGAKAAAGARAGDGATAAVSSAESAVAAAAAAARPRQRRFQAGVAGLTVGFTKASQLLYRLALRAMTVQATQE
eukprot:SAG25_NODE_3160_length_1190_cov_1.443630_1_plen_76_part_10